MTSKRSFKKQSVLLHLAEPMDRVGSVISLPARSISAIQRLETGACIVYDIAGNTWRFKNYDDIVTRFEEALKEG